MKCIAVFLALFITALTISVLLLNDVKIPSIVLMWGDMFKAIGISYE